MDLKTINKEQIILEVAEKLFIDKGFAGTKTMEIADIAGVNHALLHYYYRSKENLFNRIFEQKASQMLENFSLIFDNNSTFFEKVKEGIVAHFEFLSKNPKLPIFIMREIIADKSRKEFVLNNIFPVGKDILKKFNYAVRKEIENGLIRPVKTIDLLLNIVSLNVFSFITAQIFFDTENEADCEKLRIFLDERKNNNVELIINSLKPL